MRTRIEQGISSVFVYRAYRTQVTAGADLVNCRGTRILPLFCVPHVLTRRRFATTLVGYHGPYDTVSYSYVPREITNSLYQ